MAPQTFRHPHRVTYAECTLGNHVYYARYLDLLEAARGEFFRSLGRPFSSLQQEDVIFPVIECHLHYLAPARYDDTLATELWLTRVQRVRLEFAYRVTREDGRDLLRATTLHACASADEKPRRLPEDLEQVLGPFLKQTENL